MGPSGTPPLDAHLPFSLSAIFSSCWTVLLAIPQPAPRSCLLSFELKLSFSLLSTHFNCHVYILPCKGAFGIFANGRHRLGTFKRLSRLPWHWTEPGKRKTILSFFKVQTTRFDRAILMISLLQWCPMVHVFSSTKYILSNKVGRGGGWREDFQ